METTDDKPMTASQIAGICNSKPTTATISYWSIRGVKVGDSRVKLKRIKEGGRFVYFKSDLDEFLRKLNDC